jgi:hypothetical protein
MSVRLNPCAFSDMYWLLVQAFLDIIERDLFHTHMKKLASLSSIIIH